MIVRATSFSDPQAQQLIAELLADLAQRYGGEGDESPIEARQFEAPEGVFMVAWLGGIPVGCGGWRTVGDDAEIKRMYTRSQARGLGVARAVLNALENAARQSGLLRTILMTGDRQPEAIGLYESCGYQQIPSFGYYKNEPGAVGYARKL
ncbi:MAG: GNAT family N-acetyltransferase [Micromonosporaceae bacterium]